MDVYRIKMKIGSNEFEAEGPEDLVREQFDAWKELILSTPTIPPPQNQGSSSSEEIVDSDNTQNPPDPIENRLKHIMKVKDRVVSLTVPAKNVDDAILLVLYGQKVLRHNESVTGAEIMDGLQATGHKVERVDRILEKADRAGNAIVIGARRAKRYRLTNRGVNKAREIAERSIELVA